MGRRTDRRTERLLETAALKTAEEKKFLLKLCRSRVRKSNFVYLNAVRTITLEARKNDERRGKMGLLGLILPVQRMFSSTGED